MRELRIRLKEALDTAGIEIPFQQRTLWIRNEGEADAGPLAAGGSGGGDEVEDGDTDDEVDDDADDTDDAGHDDGEAPEDAAGASWTPSGEGDQT